MRSGVVRRTARTVALPDASRLTIAGGTGGGGTSGSVEGPVPVRDAGVWPASAPSADRTAPITRTSVDTPTRANGLKVTSESDHSVDLQHDRAVHECGIRGRQGVPLVVVHQKELAAGAVLPSEPHVRGERVRR